MNSIEELMRKHDDVYAVGESEIFHCNQNGAYGKGVLLDKKCFRVLAGSVGRIEVADSCPTQVKSLREKLIKAGRAKVERGAYVMLSDWDFSSPSTAAAFLTGYNRSGLVVWENNQGTSLRQVLKARLSELEKGSDHPKGVSEKLFCNQNDARGMGVVLSNNHFRVCRLSRGRSAIAESCPKSIVALREKLTKSGLIIPDGFQFVMQADYDFDSSSAAAQFLTGYSRNGLEVWKNSKGQTLKQLQNAAKSR